MDTANKYPNVVVELTAIGREFVEEYRSLVLARSLSQTGFVADSMAPEVIADDDALHLAIGLAYYWYYVENGRRAGRMPPINRIQRWVEITGLAPYPDKNGNTPSLRSLAFLIARKIGREGTKGKKIIQDMIEQNRDRWTERLAMAVSEDIRTRATEMIKKLA